jgi:hypothetical protein
MLGTYASALLVIGASLAIGQAVLTVCGWRRWSWLSPAVGVALLLAVAWGSVRLPGDATAAAIALGVVTLAALLVLWRLRPAGEAGLVREGGPAALLALAGASIPFFVEGHFGVLGTSFNPDMGQQLFGADWLLDPNRPEPDLVANGYPLGPHALAAALAKVTGGNLVSAFSGLTIAIPVLAALTALTVLGQLAPVQRAAGAALVALPYMAATYLAQGLFKELLQALFVLAFALCLHELARGEPAARDRRALLAAVPLGVIALGSVYAYSAPGLVWLGAIAALFAALELLRARRGGRNVGAVVRRALAPAAVGLAIVIVAAAPELGRMIEFRGTAVDVARASEPDVGAKHAAGRSADGGGGPQPGGGGVGDATSDGGASTAEVEFDNQLGNLFDEISPLEALGIWPTGDFRLDPGSGAAPAAFFYACGLLAALALGVALLSWWSRGETAIPAALAVAVAVYVAARAASTPYTAAKATLMIAPLATLIPVRELLSSGAAAAPRRLLSPRLRLALGGLFVLAAGFSSLLALVNAPVGPRDYSPGLALLRSAVAGDSVLVLAPEKQIADEHAEQFIAWELRGVPSVSVAAGGGETRRGAPPGGVAYVITGRAGPSPPYRGAELVKRVKPYRLWRVGPG